MILNYILLETIGGSSLSGFILPLAAMAVIYLFFLRPQNKKQTEEKKFRNELKKGDDIVTQSGIIGQIVNIGDGVVTLQIGNKGTMKVITGVISKELTDSYNK